MNLFIESVARLLQLTTPGLLKGNRFLPLDDRAGAVGCLTLRQQTGSLLGKCASMAIIAGELLVDGIDMEERMSFRAQLLQLGAAALCEDGVAGIAVARLDAAGVCAFVGAIMASEATGPFFVADIIWVSTPIRFHLGENVVLENSLSGGNGRSNFRFAGVFCVEGFRNFRERFFFGAVKGDQSGDDI